MAERESVPNVLRQVSGRCSLIPPIRLARLAGSSRGLMGRNLFSHDRGLQLGQDRLALRQRQPECFRRQRGSLNGVLMT